MAEEQRWRDAHPHGCRRPGVGSAADRARKVGRGLASGRATGRGMRSLGRHGRASRFTVAKAKRASEAQGAGESGLPRLIQMHVFNTAGDTAVAISLAGSLFFTVPSGEARDQVALFLGLTMLPFVIVAPLIGPFLDRFAHGRRWAIGATMAFRAFLCWVLAARSPTTRRGSSPPRSACSSRPRRTASRGRPPYPACCPATSRWSRPTAGSRSRASSAPRSRRRSPRWRRWRARSGRCATGSRCS